MNIVTQKNASLLRRYFIEYVVLSLTLAVIFLFYKLDNMNTKIIEIQTMVIEKNTQSNNDLKLELQNLKNYTR